MLRKTNTTPLTDLTQGEAKRAGTAPRRQIVGRLRFQEGERGGSVPGLGFRVLIFRFSNVTGRADFGTKSVRKQAGTPAR